MLRKGKLTGTGKVAELDHKAMAAMMIGDQPIAALDSRAPVPAGARSILAVKALKAPDRTGLKTINIGELDVKSGEIVGIAGISGNGQKEFLEVLAGQRQRDGGEVLVKGSPYGASRAEARTLNVRFIPEEPLRNACAPRMTVAENMAFRTFDLERGRQAGELDQHGRDQGLCGAPGRAVQGQDRLARLADRSRCRAATSSAPCSPAN